MGKNSELERLFGEWKANYSDKDGFIYDGIIDENLYNMAEHKVLFIMKEPNDPKKGSWDFRTWWKKKIKHRFSRRIAEWAYGILDNNFPPYDSIWSKNAYSKVQEALNSIAFMNVKKTGGKDASSKSEINRIIKRDRDSIHEEIKIINPEIIILGLSWRSSVELLFPNLNWHNTGYSIIISKYGNAKIIDFYHPSSRSSPVALYCLLEKIIKSKQFSSL